KELKKIILVTLQNTMVPLLDDFLVEAIKKTDGTHFVWWLRHHPGMNQKEKNELAEIIHANKLNGKVNIEEASSVPLPIALFKSTIHLSKYSGSILEAALLNKPNIIFDELGKEAYSILIEEG